MTDFICKFTTFRLITSRRLRLDNLRLTSRRLRLENLRLTSRRLKLENLSLIRKSFQSRE